MEVYKKQFFPLKNFMVARYRDNNTENIIIISQIRIHSDNFTMVQTPVDCLTDPGDTGEISQ